jgi:hypothetical protein
MLIGDFCYFLIAACLGSGAGWLMSWPWLAALHDSELFQKGSWQAITYGLFSGLKIVLLAFFFYYVLHHTALPFIIVLGSFFCVIGLNIKKAITYGKS